MSMFSLNQKTDNKILFVHLPKSGGMSLYNALADAVGSRKSIRFYSRAEEQQNKYLGMDDKALRKYSLISGHFPYPFFLKKPILDYKVISVLRDPVDRELSAYFYMKTRQEHPQHAKLKRMDFHDFLDGRISRDQSNRQCYLISGENNFEVAKKTIDENYFLVSTVEYMKEFCEVLEQRLGLGKITVKRDNETLFRMKRNELHPEIIEKIIRLNEEDIKLYRYVKEKFEMEYLGSQALSNVKNGSD